MYALDTNTLIFYFKGAGRVAENLLSAAPREIAVPAIVLFELEVGIARSANPKKRRNQLRALLTLVSILPLDANAAKLAADIRVRLEALGLPIGWMDTLIAGIAMAHGAVLVTHNTEEFSRVKGLSVVDWF
jgi:tRNA(fMet)-specific endonuclease VapC